MKKVILLLAVCTIGLTGLSQKLGHINGQALVEHMPEYKTAYEELNAYKQQYEDALVAMQGEYDKMIQEFQKVEQTAPKAILDAKVKDIEAKRQGIYDFQEQASADVSSEEMKKVDPILKKAKAAIEEVAKANGFAYVFDSGTGTLLYLGGEDVTPLVCTKLGIPDFSKELAADPTKSGAGQK
jgi:outer membrane protein